MKIVILGAGQVGGTLAFNLSNEANDITVVDVNETFLRDLRDRLDIGVVCGHASHPGILLQAGIEDADMLIAVTSDDEINMVACQIAHSLFHTPTKIARIRSQEYASYPGLYKNEAVPVDVIISPEQIVSNYIYRLVEQPGALQVLDFAKGSVQLVAVRAYYGGPLVGQELRFLRKHMPNVETRVAAIYRRNHAIVPEGSTVLEADDEVFFLAAKNDIRAVMSELRRVDRPYKRIVIAGGGNIGLSLAQKLEARYSVKIIEYSQTRAQFLSEHLERTIVLQGSASDQNLLLEENIEDSDVFLEIDIAISPQQATIGSLLTHVRRGDIVNVHSLRRGAAEAIEVVAHGDHKNSKVVGRTLEEIDLPEGATIGAVVRAKKDNEHEVLIAHDDIVIESGDHVVVFLVDKQYTRDIERLFQVGFTFF